MKTKKHPKTKKNPKIKKNPKTKKPSKTNTQELKRLQKELLEVRTENERLKEDLRYQQVDSVWDSLKAAAMNTLEELYLPNGGKEFSLLLWDYDFKALFLRFPLPGDDFQKAKLHMAALDRSDNRYYADKKPLLTLPGYAPPYPDMLEPGIPIL